MLKTINKILLVIDKFINVIIFIFLLMLLLIGAYGLYDTYHIYDKVTLGEEIEKVKKDEIISFDELLKINKDAVGWIKINDTKIDYPVMQSSNNQDYLNKSYNGEYNYAGSIFLDYRNDSKFNDSYNILYGHNLSVGGMFSDIEKYEDQNYFNSHLNGTLYLPNTKYKIEVITYSIININDKVPYDLFFNRNGMQKTLLTYFLAKAKYINNYDVNNIENDNSKLLLLSTCDNNNQNKRLVLLTKLIEENNED